MDPVLWAGHRWMTIRRSGKCWERRTTCRQSRHPGELRTWMQEPMCMAWGQFCSPFYRATLPMKLANRQSLQVHVVLACCLRLSRIPTRPDRDYILDSRDRRNIGSDTLIPDTNRVPCSGRVQCGQNDQDRVGSKPNSLQIHEI